MQREAGSGDHVEEMKTRWSELRKLQHGIAQQCDDANGDASAVLCHNGGTCKPPDYSPQSPCDCPDGFRGPSCEETCTLQCQHGGQCKFEDNGEGFSAAPWGQAEDGMFCSCPRGFAGLHCEYEAQACGSGETVCLNGSACVRDRPGDGYRCKRPQQARQLERCNPSPQHVEFYEGMAVAAFCLNEGTCREDESGDEVYVAAPVWIAVVISAAD